MHEIEEAILTLTGWSLLELVRQDDEAGKNWKFRFRLKEIKILSGIYTVEQMCSLRMM